MLPEDGHHGDIGIGALGGSLPQFRRARGGIVVTRGATLFGEHSLAALRVAIAAEILLGPNEAGDLPHLFLRELRRTLHGGLVVPHIDGDLSQGLIAQARIERQLADVAGGATLGLK